jgi:peptide/nickel transport system ATP-binding protein
VLGIVGESGSGKSVSSMAIMGLLPKSARITGSVLPWGRRPADARAPAARALRGRKIAMVFQDPMTAMNPVYSVGDQLAEAVLSHETMPRKKAFARAEEMLELVGIPSRSSASMLPPRVLRWDASARDDRHGGHQQPGHHHRRRADHGAGRDRAGPDPREAAGGQGRRRRCHRPDHPRPGRDRGHGPPGAGHVCRQGRRGVRHRLAVRPSSHALHRRPARIDPGAGDNGDERLRPIRGTPPSLIRLPAGCSFAPRCPLVTDLCRAEEPPLLPTDQEGHVAACHHWEKLAEVEDPRAFFRAESEALR